MENDLSETCDLIQDPAQKSSEKQYKEWKVAIVELAPRARTRS